jgi:hypothetical protein
MEDKKLTTEHTENTEKGREISFYYCIKSYECVFLAPFISVFSVFSVVRNFSFFLRFNNIQFELTKKLIWSGVFAPATTSKNQNY